jgi:molybdate transport system substrate-binding protein
MLKRFVLRGCALLTWIALSPAAAFAQGELTVFVGGAVTGPVREASAGFERSSGRKIVYVSDTTGALQKRLASGQVADIVVVAAPGMDALLQQKLVVPGTRAGAAAPDLSTPDTFKAALLAARSVSYVNPAAGGTSGTYFEGLLQRMGIAEAMKPKTVYRLQGSEVAAAVASGEAELGISFTSELQPNKGVRVAGALPSAIQLPTIYAAAVPTTARNRDAADALLRVLAGPGARAAFTNAGLEPLAQAR